jgi:TonB-dependent SusC/RagA subfamily outer membrane receptor
MSTSQRTLVSRVSSSIVFGLVLASIIGCSRPYSVRPAPTPEQSVSDGYVEKPKDQVSGTATSLTFTDAQTRQVSRVEELLEAFPGVIVRRAGGGGFSVSIRGVGSLMSSEEPLYVVDGMPIEVRRGNGLGWLSPADVVRIDLLKNPSETSIYGVRGGNGVIVITTKRHR